MTAYAAFLRAINVGASRKVPMADLRATLTGAGLTDVATYIQSGNVVLRSDLGEDALVELLETVIAGSFGFAVPTMVRTASELADLIAAGPLDASLDPARVFVVFLPAPPSHAAATVVDGATFAPERYEIRGRDVHLALPGGMGTSKLAVALARPRGPTAAGTARNWTTVLTLHEMLNAIDA